MILSNSIADAVRRADALGAQLADARAEAAAAVAEVGAMARRGDDMTDTLAGAPVTSRSHLGHISAASRLRLAGARAEAEALRLAAAAWAAQFESMRAALADADGAVALAVREDVCRDHRRSPSRLTFLIWQVRTPS